MRLEVRGPLDLEATLYSGQAFRWRKRDSEWHDGFVGRHAVSVRVQGGVLECQGHPLPSEKELRHYFRLDGSHEAFLRDVRRDAALDVAVQAFRGLRLLQQDPWEVFVAYIVSQNSNIAKITRTLEALPGLASEAPDPEPVRAPFPSPAQLAALSVEELRKTGMGYRAPLLHRAIRLVDEGDVDLARLASQAYESTHAALLEVPGVGDKVADCVQLYGLGQLGAFPVDVWIGRTLRETYFPRKRMNAVAWGAWARDHFGPMAGYAQHYLFHYRRVVGALPRVRASQARRLRVPAHSRSRRARAVLATGGNRNPA